MRQITLASQGNFEKYGRNSKREQFFAGDAANADKWLRTLNQHLDGRIPIDMINAGGTDHRAVE